jgi:hypothetical protein
VGPFFRKQTTKVRGLVSRSVEESPVNAIQQPRSRFFQRTCCVPKESNHVRMAKAAPSFRNVRLHAGGRIKQLIFVPEIPVRRRVLSHDRVHLEFERLGCPYAIKSSSR